MLRAKLPGDRVILTPENRARLLRLGAAMNHDVHDVMGIVSVKTYKRWVREQAEGRKPGRVGRPRKMTTSLRALIRGWRGSARDNGVTEAYHGTEPSPPPLCPWDMLCCDPSAPPRHVGRACRASAPLSCEAVSRQEH